MKLRPKPIKGKTFRFLDLPAELRNAIYEIICSSDPIKLTRRLSTARNVRSHRKERHGAYNYLQLAHINQQIRREFLPVYFSNITPNFHFNDAFHFTRAFLLPRQAHINAVTVVINMTGITESNKRGIDLYPLLKFLRQSSDATLEFTRDPGRFVLVDLGIKRWSINKLFAYFTAPPKTLNKKKWAQYFDKYVTAIFITPSNTPHVKVVVKHAATEFWMGSENNGVEKNAWIEKTGFPKGIVRLYSGGMWRIVRKRWTVDVKGS